ncbi:type II toxin-antitoxin system PemK/MazF family toxin [Nocardia sp. NPDC051750]|uniref:type II toxin-antitoxin system PemK/MazF family toxin n=1 Tax=Nocardia sp. NPDC051750 TaxID=3364325 RepID=UPI0037A01216
MNRGEIWTYQALARTRRVLVVSADELNAAGKPITVDITDTAPTGVVALLSVPLPDRSGYIRVRALAFADPDRFTERVAVLPDNVMDQVNMALRAALAL